MYQKDLADEVASWQCELRRRGQCKARVRLDRNNEFLQELNDHTHPPIKRKVEVVKVKASIRRRAETSLGTPQQIITSKLERISEAATVSLPQMNIITRNIPQSRYRNELSSLPSRGLLIEDRFTTNVSADFKMWPISPV